jgi:PhnB protein
MHLNTYLNFKGNCAEAFRNYEQHLGAKIGMMMTFGQMPEPKTIPPGMEDGVMHASLEIGGTRVMASDIPGAEPMRSAYLCVAVDTDAEAERIYNALADGGEVFMKMGETFFASRFGQLRDRFGISWMVIHERPMPSGPPPTNQN